MRYIAIAIALLGLSCCSSNRILARTSHEIGCAPSEITIVAHADNEVGHSWLVDCESRGSFSCFEDREDGQVHCEELTR